MLGASSKSTLAKAKYRTFRDAVNIRRMPAAPSALGGHTREEGMRSIA
jgi:hypothetical protein